MDLFEFQGKSLFARVGVPAGVRGVNDLAMDPRLAAAVGLARHGAESAREARHGRGFLSKVRRPIREFFQEYF